MNEPMRTLGLYQPYAEMMLHGKIETRWIRAGTKPPFPLGPYMLYACKSDYPLTTLSQIAGEKQYKRITETINGLQLIRGAALCTGDLVKIIYIIPGMDDQTFVRYQGPMEYKNKAGNIVKRVRVGLIFENVRRITPFPFKGKQGVGILSAEDRKKISYPH